MTEFGDYIHHKVLDGMIMNPLSNFNGVAIEGFEWVSN